MSNTKGKSYPLQYSKVRCFKYNFLSYHFKFHLNEYHYLIIVFGVKVIRFLMPESIDPVDPVELSLWAAFLGATGVRLPFSNW